MACTTRPTTPTRLKQALLDIITNVQTRATSFSSAAASSLQVRSARRHAHSALQAGAQQDGAVAGLPLPLQPGARSACWAATRNPAAGGDLNSDGDCDDTHLIDATARPSSRTTRVTSFSCRRPPRPATPFWEAGAKLRPAVGNTTNWKTRHIFTIVDSNGDEQAGHHGTRPSSSARPTSAMLRDYLGISDNPTACTDLAARCIGQRQPDAGRVRPAGHPLVPRRGRAQPRPEPARLRPAVPAARHLPLLADERGAAHPDALLRLLQQCTLRALLRRHRARGGHRCPSRARRRTTATRTRRAGGTRSSWWAANGGMLHAFHNGKATGLGRGGRSLASAVRRRARARSCGPSSRRTCCPSCAPTSASTPTSWTARPWCATCGWTAPAAAGRRQEAVAGVPHRGRGGHGPWRRAPLRDGPHPPAGQRTRTTRPARACPTPPGDFLWMWPQPCDPLALQVGESFSNFAPRPPPIGPVALSRQRGRCAAHAV